MQQPNSYCSHCGSTVEAGSKFCENCGAPTVTAPTPQQDHFPQPAVNPPPPPPASPYPPASAGYPPPAPSYPASYPPRPVGLPPPQYPRPYAVPPPKSSNTCLTVLSIGCLVVVCLVVAGIGATFLLGDRITAIFDQVASQLEIPTNLPQVDPGFFPTATLNPSGPVNQDPGLLSPDDPVVSIPTGNQELTDSLIVDDFSSNALGWEQNDSDVSARNYEQGAYFIYVKQPGYISWSQVPVDFTPYEIEFDASSPITDPGGHFGVLCQFQDDNNYIVVDIDLSSHDFSIASVKDDERTALLETEWVTFYGLYTTADASNHFAVSCYPSWISLSVNGEMAGQVDLVGREPFSTSGGMALFVGAWDNIGPDGYWIYFDNLTAWIPVQ